MLFFLWTSIGAVDGAAHPQITPAPGHSLDKRLPKGATLFWLPTIVDGTYLSYKTEQCNGGTLTNSQSFINCCASTSCPNFYYPTTCSAGTLLWDGGSQACPNVASATGPMTCGIKTFYQSISDGSPFTQYFCQSVPGWVNQTLFILEPQPQTLALDYANALFAHFNGSHPDDVTIPVGTTTQSGSSSSSASSSSSSGIINPTNSAAQSSSFGLPGSSPTAVDSSSSSSTPSPSSSMAKSEIGIIIGSVLGGIVLILLLGFFLFNLTLKRITRMLAGQKTNEKNDDYPPELPDNPLNPETSSELDGAQKFYHMSDEVHEAPAKDRYSVMAPVELPADNHESWSSPSPSEIKEPSKVLIVEHSGEGSEEKANFI